MKPSRALLAGLCLLSGCVFDTLAPPPPVVPPPPGFWKDSAIDAKVDTMLRHLEALRELNFVRPVHAAVISREEYRRQVEARIEEAISDSLSRAISRELSQWGLFPDTLLDFKTLYGGQQGGFAAGYYVIGADSLYVLGESAGNDAVLDGILPHELLHALQDQHFADYFYGPDSGGAYASDYGLHRTCVIEGDAVLSAMLYATHFLWPRQQAPESLVIATARQGRSWALDEWESLQPPETMAIPAYAPYYLGFPYVTDVYASADRWDPVHRWDSVNALYSGPDRPSVAVLDPSAPAAVAIDLSGLVDTAGAYADDAAHGSIGLMSLVSQDMDSAGVVSGLGWRGDHYVYALRPGETFGTLLWVGVFASGEQAGAMADWLGRALRRRFGGDTGAVLTGVDYNIAVADSQRHWVWPGLRTSLVTAGREVWWLEAPPGRDWGPALAALQADYAERGPTALARAAPPGGKGGGMRAPAAPKWTRLGRNRRLVF